MYNMKKIHCLLVDDEPPALDVLKNHIASVSSLELAGTCSNAVEALNLLREQTIDLLFLDIEMPHLLGTDLIRTLSKPPKVIFTTAYRQFAVEGFELNAVDYLLKPISFERFLKAINKILHMSLPVQANGDNINSVKNESFEPDLYVRSDRKTIKISTDEILYIEAVRDYVKIVCINKTILSKQSIASLEETLSKSHFVRIHRSYIVSVKKVTAFTQEIVEIAKQQLPISRMYRNEVSKLFHFKINQNT